MQIMIKIKKEYKRITQINGNCYKYIKRDTPLYF